jgi:hypothetical protein
MIDWCSSYPLIAGVVTFLLAWVDWLLTILQERERQLHYGEHYQSYPVNTIEGNQRYQSAVNARRFVEPRHLIPALIMAVAVCSASLFIVGVAVGGVSSAARQLVWMRKVPAIDKPDEPPLSVHVIGQETKTGEL